MTGRDLRMTAGGERGRAVTIVVDGRALAAHEGESIAAALVASGRRLTRFTARAAEPRGYFCGMGVCHDCLTWSATASSPRSSSRGSPAASTRTGPRSADGCR